MANGNFDDFDSQVSVEELHDLDFAERFDSEPEGVEAQAA